MLTSISTDIRPESEIIIWASNHCHINEGEIHSSPTHHWMETTQTLNITEKGWSWKSGKENDEMFAHLIRIMYFLPYFFIIIISVTVTSSSHILFYMDIPTVPLVPRLSDSGRCIFWETAQQHSTALVLKCSAQHLIKTERFKRATTSALCTCANAAATSVGCSYPWCFLTYFCRSTSF